MLLAVTLVSVSGFHASRGPIAAARCPAATMQFGFGKKPSEPKTPKASKAEKLPLPPLPANLRKAASYVPPSANEDLAQFRAENKEYIASVRRFRYKDDIS